MQDDGWLCITLDQFASNPGVGFRSFRQGSKQRVGSVGRGKEQHANTAIKGSGKLIRLNVSSCLQPGKERRQRIAGKVQHKAEVIIINAGRVFNQTTTGDMHDPMNTACCQRTAHGFLVKTRRCQQSLTQSFIRFAGGHCGKVCDGNFNNFANK